VFHLDWYIWNSFDQVWSKWCFPSRRFYVALIFIKLPYTIVRQTEVYQKSYFWAYIHLLYRYLENIKTDQLGRFRHWLPKYFPKTLLKWYWRDSDRSKPLGHGLHKNKSVISNNKTDLEGKCYIIDFDPGVIAWVVILQDENVRAIEFSYSEFLLASTNKGIRYTILK
jgi:hypothetical protein